MVDHFIYGIIAAAIFAYVALLCRPTRYYPGWYDTIWFALTLGFFAAWEIAQSFFHPPTLGDVAQLAASTVPLGCIILGRMVWRVLPHR